MLKALLFDLDDTLVDRDGAFRECVRRHFSDSGVRSLLSQLDNGGYGNRETLFLEWQRQSGKPMNQDLFGELLADHIQPDVELLCILRELSEKFKLGVITNGGSKNQRRKFCAAGLDQVIPPEHVWVSAEVGMVKPDPAIYLLASRMIDEPPANCLFMGDHADDSAGATAAGMRARRIERVLNAERLLQLTSEEEAK